MIVIILAIATSGYFVIGKIFGGSSSDAGSVDVEALRAEIGKLIVLDDAEEASASVVTADDVEKLGQTPFFSGIRNGDEILILSQSRRIIIYRPSEKILVNVGPIMDDPASEETPESPEAPETE
jgi:hypothetical protein